MFSFGMTFGPAITALLLLVASPAEVLAVNGVTFVFSAALLSGVPMGRGGETPGDGETLWSATRAGARAAAGIPGIGALLVIGAVSVLAAAVMNVAEPLLATGPLAAGKSGYSLLVGVYGARNGGRLDPERPHGIRRLATCAIACWWASVSTACGMLASALAPNLGWAIVSFALTGLSNSLIMGPETRLFQELVAERVLGRVFGLQAMLADIAYVIAFLASGLLLTTLGVRSVFALGGSALLALAIAGWIGFHPSRATETFPAALPETG